jgi:hypothetical protein
MKTTTSFRATFRRAAVAACTFLAVASLTGVGAASAAPAVDTSHPRTAAHDDATPGKNAKASASAHARRIRAKAHRNAARARAHARALRDADSNKG